MQIKITTGGKIDSDGILHQHLVYNHLTNPKAGWDGLIMYAEKRYLFTMLTSGLSSPTQAYKGVGPSKGDATAVKTVIKPIPQGGTTSELYWAFSIMGKVQRASRIVRFIGTPTPASAGRGGLFTMVAADNTIKHQMNVLFPNGKLARVMREGRVNGDGTVILDMQCYPGDTFNQNSWMMGKNTVFASFTTVGERSRHGYSVFYTPDKYINHVTKQRKGFSISGDAATQEIVWYEANGVKGFSYVAETWARQQFLLEDDNQKWDGVSTMRDQFGNLLQDPGMYDEKGEPIIAGDGYLEQIKGYNDMIASGSDGLPTLDDVRDMLGQLDEGRDHDNSDPWYCVTGRGGMRAAAEIGKQLNQQMGITYHMNLDPNSQTYGGQKVANGFNMVTLNVDGKTIIFVENVQWNNRDKYPAVGPNGETIKGSTFHFMDLSDMGDKRGVEIRARAGNGRNRNMIFEWFEGMTGKPGKSDHPGDFSAFHMFKENMVCVYRPKSNGIIYPNVALW